MKILLTTVLLATCLIFFCAATEENHREKRWTFNPTEIISLYPKVKEILKDILKLWGVLQANPELNVINDDALEHQMLGRLVTISSKVTDLESEVRQVSDIAQTILEALPKILQLEFQMHDLTQIIEQIQFSEEQMRNYLIRGYKNITPDDTQVTPERLMYMYDINETEVGLKKEPTVELVSNKIMKREADQNWIVEKFTLIDFSTWAVGHSFNSLQSLLNRMNNLIAKDTEDSLFYNLLSLSEETKVNLCNLRQSPQQTLYNLYNTIAIADLKGNTILQFSYMLLRMYQKGNFTVEAQIALSNYEKYAKQKLEVARKVIAEADKSFYRCDPKQYVEGVTYTKLTKLLQGYIENEVNLNPYGTCRENCQYYQYTEYNGCFKNQFCANQPSCKGKVTECRYVDSDMDICVSSNPDRRYEWVEYENGKVLGSKGVCEKKNLYKVDSWWRYLFWHCSYCLCLCDDTDERSERYFNMREVTSDIEQNKVVTGVRLVKNNHIIHMQIQQGVLTPLGFVNKTTLSWKQVDNYTIDDDNVQNNVDYHTMSWFERAVDTDEVFGPPEHVVTGLRFRKIGTHLNLEVRVTPINFTTGEVFKAAHSYWLGNDNTGVNAQNPRTEIVLENPDIPIRNGPHSVISKHNKYIEFQATSFDTDAAQNTVPYLDSQALTSQGFPLSGLGLIHRGKKGSGGFLAPKLISYDFAPHLKLN